MCMIDGADGMCVVLHSKIQKARKDHKCNECYRQIKKGENYLNEAALWDGNVDTVKTCSHCQVCRDWLSAECGGWIYEGIREDMHEHTLNGYYGKGVIMLSVGINKKWQTKDGRLWRIPSIPKTTHERMAA